MKNKLYSILLFSCSLFALISCVNEQEDLFDKSAANRLAVAQTEAINSLQSATNGWIVQYYSNPEKYGGFTMLMKFGADMHVQVAGESVIVGDRTRVADSMYGMIGDRGPVLTFSTYNEIFHNFASPGGDGLGLEGDYEFMVIYASNDSISLKGKKRGAIITMTRLSETETWDSYLAKIDKVSQEVANASPLNWSLFLNTHDKNGKPVIDTLQVVIDKYRKMNLTRTFILDETTTDNPSLIGTKDTEELITSFILTPEGMKIYQPFGIAKDTINTFVWESATESMKATNANMSPIKMNFLDFFAISQDIWLVDTLNMPKEFEDKYRAVQKAVLDFYSKPLYYMFLSYEPIARKNPLLSFRVGGESAWIEMTYNIFDNNVIQIGTGKSLSSQLAQDCLDMREFSALIALITQSRYLAKTDNPLNPTNMDFHATRGSKQRVFSLERVGAGSLFPIKE